MSQRTFPITHKRVTVFLFLLLPVLSFAQYQSLTQDAPFFQEQARQYQRWLDHAGLSSVLYVEDVGVSPDHVSLHLGLRYSNIDSLVAAWSILKANFDVQTAISLEQELFYKMTHFMDLDQEQAEVVIADTHFPGRFQLFLRRVYFAYFTVQVEERNPKTKYRDINIQVSNLSNMKKYSLEEFRQLYSRDQVFETIYRYAQKRYGSSECIQRFPKLRLLERGEVLRFEITDLCREVLTDAANPLLCQIVNRLGHSCNWVKREKLEFTIGYDQSPQGFSISLAVDGKYGSGRYREVPRGGYYSMEMDFDPYLEDYADELSVMLRSVILYGNP